MTRFFKDFKKYWGYALYSARSELKAEVASSYLNWIWWILEPMCFMLIYTFISGFVFRSNEQYFPIFVYIGLTVWDFFNKSVQASVKLVKNRNSIVSKVFLPKFILAESKLMVYGFKTLISFGIVVLLMVVYRVPISLNILYVIPLVATLILVTFGCMCILLHFGVYILDLANIINIVLKLVFYMTGVFYSIESKIGPLSKPLADLLGKCNPLAFIASGLRSCLIYSEGVDLPVLVAWFLLGIGLSAIGIRTIYKNENSYVKVI